MKLEDQVVSLELAKKLKELGVKKESLFWYKRKYDLKKQEWTVWEIKDWVNKVLLCKKGDTLFGEPVIYSAFTVAELGEMLPARDYMTSDKVDLASWQSFKSENEWVCHLAWRYTRTNLEMTKANTEADARAKMLIYLLENKLI